MTKKSILNHQTSTFILRNLKRLRVKVFSKAYQLMTKSHILLKCKWWRVQGHDWKEKTQENLNNLVPKQIDFIMKQAESRNPLIGTKHQERTKEIREGKFKNWMPAFALSFKYLFKMFKKIREAREDSAKNQKKKSFRKFTIYASKFSLIIE